jgi:hypothetical protein
MPIVFKVETNSISLSSFLTFMFTQLLVKDLLKTFLFMEEDILSHMFSVYISVELAFNAF